MTSKLRKKLKDQKYNQVSMVLVFLVLTTHPGPVYPLSKENKAKIIHSFIISVSLHLPSLLLSRGQQPTEGKSPIAMEL